MGLNLIPLMKRMTIKKKDLTTEFWNPDETFAWAQNELLAEIERQYNLGLPVRIIVLKARQLGISTASEGVLFNWCFMLPGASSLVIAHETKSSQHLFGMTKTMWETWPFRKLFTEKHSSAKLLGWLETRSQMSVATARNTGSGRSFTYHAVHCSECAFWDSPEELMTGLNQSVPNTHGTIIIIESTANGVGNWYYEEWQRAMRGDSSYIPLFFPWYKHAEYDIPNTTLKYNDLDADERQILAEFPEMTISKLAWRRRTIMDTCLGDPKRFQQEYPMTPTEAFLSTGTNVFPLQRLEECFKPKHGVRGMLNNNNGKLEFVKTIDGPLTIYKWPSKNKVKGKYVVAGDPSRTTYGDGAAIQVINRFTMEQVAVWRGHVDPVPFAHKIMELGYYYNTALVNTEIEGPGYATIGVLQELSYPYIWRHRWMDRSPGKVSNTFGWSTNFQRKHWAVAQTINYISQHHLTIHDRSTYLEMRDYVALPGGELGPASESGYDDLCMSMIIAVVTAETEAKNLSWTDDSQTTPVNDLFGKPPWDATELARSYAS